MIDNIRWLGHASSRFEGDTTIYIDPWKISPGPKADIILVSHGHRDHLSMEDIALIATEKTVLVCPPSCAEQAAASGCIIKEIRRGESLTIGDVIVTAVPSYNTDKPNHPQSSDNVGFIVEIAGERLYHAGDTDVIPEMADIRCDVALLPIGGTYTMDAKQGVEALNMIRPKIAVPIHWGDIIGSRTDAEYLAEHAPKGTAVRILPVVN